jgi:hypothetical protein
VFDLGVKLEALKKTAPRGCDESLRQEIFRLFPYDSFFPTTSLATGEPTSLVSVERSIQEYMLSD